MFNKVTPESVGIKSEWITNFINHLQNKGINMHDVLIMRGNSLCFEAYWKPFNKDFLHRQYSQTKSFVGVAIGLLSEEGKINLDDKIVSYFSDKIDKELHPFVKEQTIRDMLTMTTACRCPNWFIDDDKDRVHLYFNSSTIACPSGTSWRYDSAGSQVLSSLVERVTGKSLLEYLKEKIFNEMGFFKNAYMLKTPTGDSWGDSAMICLPYDMLAFGRFVMNYGMWNGKRLMNEQYLKDATSPLVYNNIKGHRDAHDCFGYGYQIWRTRNDSFAFVGMGQQLTICNKEKDIILVCNSDVQGAYYPYDTLIDFYFDEIVEKIDKERLDENEKSFEILQRLSSSLKLRSLQGKAYNKIQEKINGKIFIPIQDNNQKISKFSLTFDNNNGGILTYTNSQGENKLHFIMNENCFSKFPQKNYSHLVGGIPSNDSYLYDCAVSACWMDDTRFQIYIQIIDIYFGNCTMTFSFKDDFVSVDMTKTAEAFLNEYYGSFVAKIK